MAPRGAVSQFLQCEMLLRMGNCFRVGRRRGPSLQDLAAPIEAVLSSCSWYEALGIHPRASGVGTAAADPAAAATPPEGRDLEAGLTQGQQLAEEITDGAVLEAFLKVSASVHPFQNSHPEATLALRWVVEAFTKLRGRRERALLRGTQAFETPLRQQPCLKTADEAQRVFAEVVSATYDRLSLRNPEDCGLSKVGGDSLLRSLHMLHLRPYARSQQSMQHERAMLDTVLRAALIANWIIVSMVRKARMFSSSRERSRSESMASTAVAAIGGVAFSGASRMHRIVSSDNINTTRSFGADPLEPLVRCPLCRVATPSGRAIQDVHAGDGMPPCCVCTENQADVCLPCGHLCICGECFQHLPRTTAASE